MEFTLSSTAPCLLLLVVLAVWLRSRRRSRKRPPPGPPGWPLLGNMFDLGAMPHQTLYKLGFKYGPVVWLRLGSKNTMVVQSAKSAADFFKNNDSVFCDRTLIEVLTAHDYNKGSLIVGRYGSYWRMARRICTAELMSNRRINESAFIRKKCIDNTIKFIEDEVRSAKARGETGDLNLARFLFLLTFNLIGNLTLSKDLLHPQSAEAHQFYKAMDKVSTWVGKPNVADFVPLLRRFDLQNLKKKMEQDMGKAMEIVAGFIRERLEENKLGKERSGDFLDVLLGYEGDGNAGPEKLTYSQITVLTLETFMAGSDTTSSTMEWIMAELLRHPESMKKVKQELDQVVGPNRTIEEDDVNKLPYLQAVIKETFRLHPPLPLLIPRNALKDTNFMDYFIPKGTQVFVNVWAIGRDKEVWDDPLSFKPERFIGSNIDCKGQHFGLIPFGSGRRMCAGSALADRIVGFATASLLHRFDWELGGNCTPETLDMSEKAGITMKKLVPLIVRPRKRTI